MHKIWRINADIQKTDYYLVMETDPGFRTFHKPFLGRDYIQEVLWVFENGDLKFYLRVNELRAIIEASLRKILRDPKAVDRLHEQTIKYNKRYFLFAEKIRKINLYHLSDKQLVALYRKLFNLQQISHCLSFPTTWFVDCDGEDYSKYLRNLVEKKIKKMKLDLDSADTFIVLTTPLRESIGTRQEIEFLKILKDRKSFKQALIKHHYKWCWIPYGYRGPAYNLSYYQEVAQGLLRERINPDKEINKILQRTKKNQEEKQKLTKKLNLSAYEKHLFNIAAEIIWLKGFRKDCYFHGFFVMDRIFAEISKRAGLTLMQVKFLLPQEVPQALTGKDFSNLANERMKFSIIYSHGNRYTFKAGKDTKNFLKQQKFEKTKVVLTKELIGTCACGGNVKGTVRVINQPEDMPKMKHGDIMIAHATYPSLVPAMKKAAAIITEEGGITCHAAIVARELQTPCVVGVKNLLHILKDGDKVEVNANKGQIKKI